MEFEADKISADPGRKAPQLRSSHGSGANFKGRGLKRYSVPGGRSVNKQNPYLRGQGNAISGRFIDPHDSDDDSTPILASVNNGNAHADVDVRTIRKAFRRFHGLNTSRTEPKPGIPNVPPQSIVPIASIRSKMASRDIKAGETRDGIETPLNVPRDYREYGDGVSATLRSRENVNNVGVPRAACNVAESKFDPNEAWNRHVAEQDALLAQIVD